MASLRERNRRRRDADIPKLAKAAAEDPAALYDNIMAASRRLAVRSFVVGEISILVLWFGVELL